MKTLLGSLTLTVFADAAGAIDVEHSTALSPHLAEMQGAMSGRDKQHAVALRRAACAKAAAFFAFVRNPDEEVSVDDAG